MKLLLALLRNPFTLAGSLLLGAVVGKVAPSVVPSLATASTAYLSLLNMGAVPMIVVAVFLGLRRILSLPGAGARLAALVLGGALAMAACALVAATLAQMVGAGGHMSSREVTMLGAMSLTADSVTSVTLKPEAEVAEPAVGSTWRVPDNFFFALAFGSLPAILLCAVFFAVAFAAQPAAQARWLQAQLEPIYRTLELLIDRLNDFLPVVAFALAATVASAASSEGLLLMRSFLFPYFATVLLVVWVSAAVMALHLGRPQMMVLQALRKPIVVSLFASGPAAAIPGFIQAMCNQLGFRRDLVEFAAPLAPAFLRAGEAVFYAVLAVFVANVYGRTLGPMDVLLICGAATAAALVSVNAAGVRSLAAGALVLAYLDLPMEALLPAFMLLEVICEGPRNVLSIMISGALLALVSKGLPSEAPAAVASPTAGAQSLRFALTRGRAAVAAALVALAMAAAYLAGLGLGMRHVAPSDLSPPATARSLKP
jgi:Na+/H+-dicarboxylate symporter